MQLFRGRKKKIKNSQQRPTRAINKKSQLRCEGGPASHLNECINTLGNLLRERCGKVKYRRISYSAIVSISCQLDSVIELKTYHKRGVATDR